MNGNKYIFDTNAVISLLKGDNIVLEIAEKAEWIGISIISYLEFLAFPALSSDDKAIFESFIKRIEVIGLDPGNKPLIDCIINIRIKHHFKLPDAIIVSTAIVTGSILVTGDRQLHTVDEIKIIKTS